MDNLQLFHDPQISSAMLAGAGALVACAVLVQQKNKKRKVEPPQPRGLPLVGNLFQVFGDKPFLTFADWATEYGDVLRLRLGTQQAVVISSIEAAREALVTHGREMAGRPLFYTMSCLHEKERKFVFAPHADDMLKLYRKTVLADTRRRMPQLEPLVEGEVAKMKTFLFGAGETEVVVDMRSLVHKMAVNIAHGYGMGGTFSYTDPHSNQWSEVLDEYRQLLHWFRFENFLPHSHMFLRGYAERVNEFHRKSRDVFVEGINKARARSNETGDSKEVGLIDTILEMFESTKESPVSADDDAIAILRDVMFGCADGSYQPLIWALQFIAKQPEILQQLHREIDEVVGKERMPELADKDKLPYIEATIREVMRISDITTLGIPRRALSDITIKGYHIPKDTLAIVNVYAIHRDVKHWQDPLSFNPDRFFDEQNVLKPLSELSYLPFSTGSRSCPGQNLARNFLFLLFTRFFQQFDVSAAADDNIPEEMNAGGAFNPEVKPFKVKLSLRSQQQSEI